MAKVLKKLVSGKIIEKNCVPIAENVLSFNNILSFEKRKIEKKSFFFFFFAHLLDKKFTFGKENTFSLHSLTHFFRIFAE